MNYFINRSIILFIYTICIKVALGQSINDIKQLNPNVRIPVNIQQGDQLINDQNIDRIDQNSTTIIYKSNK